MSKEILKSAILDKPNEVAKSINTIMKQKIAKHYNEMNQKKGK